MKKIQLTNHIKMLYYLFFNSTFEFISNSRLFSTILYGSILYIVCHAVINYCDIEFFKVVQNYFWYIFILDIISLCYSIYQTISSPGINLNMALNSANSTLNTGNDLQVSFNLLKNKINTLLDRSKNDLTVTQIPIQPTTSQHTIPITNTSIVDEPIKHQFSTPISQLKKQHSQQQPQQPQQQTNNIQSTPITLLRDSNINVPEVIFNEDSNESVAGSDVASVMDLDDFEKSL